jgi:hypothetical protein
MLFLKEHIRGPVRECETIVLDILTEMRCKELKCTDLYNGAPVVVNRRNVEDRFGGKGRTRCLGALCDVLENEVWTAALRCVVCVILR